MTTIFPENLANEGDAIWRCPVCNESHGEDGPIADTHRHYVFHVGVVYDNNDFDFAGELYDRSMLPEFSTKVTDLMAFSDGSRANALRSLESLPMRLSGFPVRLKDFLVDCLKRQIDRVGDEGSEDEPCDYFYVMDSVEDYACDILRQCATFRGITYYGSKRQDEAFGVEARIYWAEHPIRCIEECASRVKRDLKYLDKLRLVRSEYVIRT